MERFITPESVTKGKPLRLVITHHGEASTENMFFDDVAAKVSGNNVAAPAER